MEIGIAKGSKTATMQADDDDALVQAALDHSEAFSALYLRYVKRVYHYLYSKVGNPADAEDLTAQVFMEAIESLPRYRPQGYFAAWIFTIARHRANNLFRRNTVWLPLELAENLPAADAGLLDQLVQKEQLEKLAREIQRLRADEVELLRLHFTARLTYSEMGKVLGKSETAIRMAVHRVLQKLDKAWEDDYDKT